MTARPLLLEYTARYLYWLMLAVSIWILLRGHNAPGGGFIAALVAVAATALLAIVYGCDHARRAMPLAPLTLTGSGILLALFSGMSGLTGGDAFLTHLWWHIEAGFISLKLSTVLIFDLGVFAAVWGSFTLYLLALLSNNGEST
jgi:multisubunit Na+/H+ antiporter MnhB subunit